MNRLYDLRTLGFEPEPTAEQIETAFKALALLHHPDKGGDPEKFVSIVAARDRLLAGGTSKGKCPVCDGRGRVRVTSGFASINVSCETCKGRGRG